jgi:hypothetical protein
MSEIIISVGKRWSNSRVPWQKRGSRGGKPRLTKYFIDENGKFRTKSINKLMVLAVKSKIMKRKKFFCQNCRTVFISFVKNKRDLPRCPYGCSTPG